MATFGNDMQIRFLKKNEGINNGMKIVVSVKNFAVQWYYKSYHLASISEKKGVRTSTKDSSDLLSANSLSSPYSNSNTTIPIFGLSKSFINFREPLLYVILHGLDFAPLTFFHINIYTIGGFFIVSKSLEDHVLWSGYIKTNALQYLNEQQRSSLAENIIEVSILSASFGVYDLHSNNVMIKTNRNDISLKIIDFAYCDETQTVPSITILQDNFNQLISILRIGNLEDFINYNLDHSFLRFLTAKDYHSIFTDWSLHCKKAFVSLINRIKNIIHKNSMMIYSEGVIQSRPLALLLSDHKDFPSREFLNFDEFVKYQAEIILTTMEQKIKINESFNDSFSNERLISEYIGFTNFDTIKKIVPYYYCKEDSAIIMECKSIEELLEKLTSTISPECLFKPKHIDRVYSYSKSEFEKYYLYVIDCFHHISSISMFLHE